MTCIVGHGPSMLNERYGYEIDEHDTIIRQKRCEETLQYPEVYGTRTDVVVGSFTIARMLPHHMPGCEYWVFLDSRHEDAEVGRIRQELPCTILEHACSSWNDKYRSLRTPYEIPEGVKRFTPLGHPHMSAGLHAVIYACEILNPPKLTLYGFDNVQSGEFTWSITRGPEWNKYPDHNWAVEHSMVPMIEDHYGVEVAFR